METRILDFTKGIKWDDMRAPASGINPSGSLAPPTFDTADGSLVFSKGKVITIWFQVPHTWKQGTPLKPHLHWTKTTIATGIPNWQIKYKFANVGEVMPAFTPLISGIEAVPNSNIVGKHSVFEFPDIDATDKLISSMLCIYLQRTNNASDTYVDDVKLLEFDIHYLVDSDGSTQEFIK
jgi:hypothetical protein